ncbi:MAG: hypothetical protein KAI47_26090, partial [Deltaproteobacteria bacterium]|nr:hypothetical protein [Deltaproteobacteria bacterium]
QRKIELTDDPQIWRDLQRSIAKTYEERLEDNFEAINAYRTIFDREDFDRERFDREREGSGSGDEDASLHEVLDALDRLYTREGLWSDLLEVVERKATLAEGSEANGLRFRLGAILIHEIGDADGAIDRFEGVVRDAPDNEAAIEALEALLSDEAQGARVALILEEVYRVSGDMRALVRVMETRLMTLTDRQERRDLVVRIAEISEDGLEDLRLAFDAYGRALKEDPADERIHAELDRLGALLSVTEELVDRYASSLDDIYDTVLVRSLNLKVARMLEDVLGDNVRAEKHFRLALEAGGDELEPLEALDRVLEGLERWEDLLEILDRRIQALTSPSEQAELYCRIGRVRDEHLGDMDGAFAAFREALSRDPMHRGARDAIEGLLSQETYRSGILDVLEPIYEEAGDFRKVVDLLVIRLSTLADPLDRVVLGERIAELQEDRLGDKKAAFDAYLMALAEDGANKGLIAHVERLAEELSCFEALVEGTETILSAEDVGDDILRELGLRQGRWYREKLERFDEAEARYKAIFAVLPGAVEALEALEEIYKRAGRFEEFANVLMQRAELSDDVLVKRQLLVEAARLREDTLDDTAGAVEAWRAVLDLDDIDKEGLEALTRLYEGQEAWTDLLDTLQRLVPVADDAVKQVTLRKRA